ncbi:AMP-binding protein [Acidiferrimicrobium sp. IK]|uniref:AMP-binding protein n=1 Tax=Acidiferrimicrobium sp. IK TaxID=2871700 RepID=UPI0021CB370E|nr:AMP-binding protein [Acidiferrimicrobium sp. IK]MCU4186865.1 AMP-binding protein [Acidiferrimicrobium sp. IK]
MTDDTQRLGFWWIAEDHPDLPAVVSSPSGTRTYGELAGDAHQLVHALRAAGLVDGDVVAVLAANDIGIVRASLATQEAGWYFLPLNYHLSADEVVGILSTAGAAALLVDTTTPELATLAAKLRASGAIPSRSFTSGPDVEGFTPLASALAAQPRTLPSDRRSGAVFSFTSGTTGLPKGIRRPRPPGDPSAEASNASLFGRAFHFQQLGGIHLASAAMHHVGTHSFYIGALNVGQALSILPRFDPEATLAAIDRDKVTTAYMVPTMFHRLIQLPQEVRDKYDHSHLQAVVHSAAPCPMALKQKMMDWWGPVIWETYGGTEGAATIAKPYRWLEKPGTVGRAVRGVKIAILDDDGNPLPAGEVGHVFIETGGDPFEYHGEGGVEATQSVFRGRMFTIGDLGLLDEDGYLFIRDRAKDMIISGGVNIYPTEVEAALLSHPAVGDVAVIGVPSDEWGEEIKAVVEPAPGYSASEGLAAELIAYVRERLSHYKCPRSVDFRTSLPRTDAGKLYKRKIRDEYWAQAERLV